MTFEGKDVTWDKLGEELKKIPNRDQTALQLALASDDITVGQQNEARGRCVQLVNDLGFQYLTEIGVHRIGSKAGEDEPTTQAVR